MKGCQYDTNGDGDCHLCSKPGWHCAGDQPAETKSIIATWNPSGLVTFTPSAEEPSVPDWNLGSMAGAIIIDSPGAPDEDMSQVELRGVVNWWKA